MEAMTKSFAIFGDGLKLPFALISVPEIECKTGNLGMLIGHGLGARNPALRNFSNDDWTKILAESGVHYYLANPIVLYTARGHGDSSGWERSAEHDLEQFSWPHLGSDMIALANELKIFQFIASGSSMGAATSLFAAMKEPTRVRALIMIRPPTAWDSRKERTKYLASSAKKCELEFPSGKHHLVLRGASLTDLPAVDDPIYSTVICPTLILAVEGDESHPLSTALKLKELITNSALFIAKDYNDAKENWPNIIRNFIHNIISN